MEIGKYNNFYKVFFSLFFMTRVIGRDGKTCFDSDVGIGSECLYQGDECPRLCVVDDGLTAQVYSRHPALKKSARSFIAVGAIPSTRDEFTGYLSLDTSDGKREIYAPTADFKGHYLRLIVNVH